MAGRFREALAPLVWVALLASCSGASSDAPTAVESDGSAAASTPETGTADTLSGDTQPGDTTSTDIASEGTPITFGPGPIQLVDPAVGIENLPAFQATLSITFDGDRDGTVEQWTQNEAVTMSREPMLSQFTSERTGTRPHTLQHVAVGGVEYHRGTDGACTAELPAVSTSESPDEFAPRRQPVELLPALIGGDEVGAETIGTIDTLHYAFDERSLGLASPVRATADVWVAASGGHIVRYSLVIDGASPYVGMNVVGQFTMEYELQPLDAPPVVAVPADCPAGLVDAAPPADAADLVSRPGLQTYTTAGALADVQGWYDGQLPAAGWVEVTAPLIAGDSEMLTYERAAERLVVSMSRVGTATSVFVLLTKIG
jgi:hypothetical protein